YVWLGPLCALVVFWRPWLEPHIKNLNETGKPHILPPPLDKNQTSGFAQSSKVSQSRCFAFRSLYLLYCDATFYYYLGLLESLNVGSFLHGTRGRSRGSNPADIRGSGGSSGLSWHDRAVQSRTREPDRLLHWRDPRLIHLGSPVARSRD